MLHDILGNPVSYADPAAIAALDAAADKFLAYRADPFADVDAILAEHPRFVMAHCFRGGLIATATDRNFDGELARTLQAAAALSHAANDRERAHLAALRAWADGDWARATVLWGRILEDWPRDTMALHFAHLGDFFNGWSAMLRDRVAAALPAFTRTTPRAGFVRGMYAFGLEETGALTAAEAVARGCVAENPQDAWAVHAAAHAMEMSGRSEEGIRWLAATEAGWTHENMFAYHNWWHRALFALDQDDAAAALALYDTRIRPTDSDVVLELIDATAMLWRLAARGHDTGDRFAAVAARWESRVDHGLYAFNDAHAAMAFAGAGRLDLARAQVARLRRSAEGGGSNAAMAAEAGLPLAEAVLAWGEGRFGDCADLLVAMRPRAARFGGSHAQRDIVSWTLAEAAIRAKRPALARAVTAERRAAKPESRLELRRARQAVAIDAANAA